MTTHSRTIDADAVARATKELAGDHERLHALTRGLAATDDPRALRERLDELAALLKEHFAREEHPGGLYDALGVCSGEHREALAALVDDHFNLLAQARALATRAREAGPEALAALRRDVGVLLERLREHEVREHELADSVG